MNIPLLESDTLNDLEPGSSVVVVTLYGGGELWGKALTSIFKNTPDKVAICIFEDAYKDDVAIQIANSIYQEYGIGKKVYLHKNAKNMGVVANLNLAFSRLSPANVIVLNSDVIVGPNWIMGLEEGLWDPTVATVTALSTNSTIFTVPEASQLLGINPSTDEVDEIALKIWNNHKPTYPEVPTTVSCCALFRRRALDAVGNLDEFFSPGYGEETDFSLKCSQLGFRHVTADNVLVYHEGGASFGTAVNVSKRKVLNDLEVERRYPYFRRYVQNLEADGNHPLNIAIRHNEAILRGIEIVVEGTLINENHTGTFVGAVGLLNGISKNDAVSRITVVCDSSRVRSMRTMFRKLDLNVEVLSYMQMQEGDFDIGFIPHQVYDPKVFDWMKNHTQRRLFWHLDFISTQIATYHQSPEKYFEINNNVKRTFEEADGIFFLTEETAKVALSKGIRIEESRTHILPSAPDITLHKESKAIEVENDFPKKYLLCLGVSYKHKNREFIEKLFHSIEKDYPNLVLIFAGPQPTFGSDSVAESKNVYDLGGVSDRERTKLIANASLVISPSIVEGFGLAPLEAASLGVAPLVTKTFGYQSHGLAPFWIDLDSFEDSQSALNTLLKDEMAKAHQLKAWIGNLDRYSWELSGNAFVAASFEALSQPKKHGSSYFTPTQLNWKGKIVDLIRRSGLIPPGSKRRNLAVSVLRYLTKGN